MVKRKTWQSSFNRDVKAKVKGSKQEFDNYKRTRRVLSLQQACGKLFSAVENYLMVKYQTRKRNYRSLWDMVRSDSRDRTLLQLAKQLHIFYYNGPLDIRLYEAEGYYNNVYKKMQNRLR